MSTKIKEELPKQDLELLGSECRYELDDYEELKIRLIGYYKKAKTDGLLSLEKHVKAETNKTVTEIYMLGIDGHTNEFVSEYVDIKAFWLIDLAKRETWRDRNYIVALAKELYLIKKLVLSTMQVKDVKIRPNFNDVILEPFRFTRTEVNNLPPLSKITEIDNNSLIDIKYLVDVIENLSTTYRMHAVDAFIAKTLELTHKNLAEIFIKPLTPDGIEKFSAKSMTSNDKYEYYKNKELFTLHLAARYILDGYAPRSVRDVVQLVYPEIEF